MIARIRRGFVEEINRLPIQRHELALEPNIAYPSHILVATAPVVLKEECDRRSGIPVRAIQRKFKNIRTGKGLRDLDFLVWGEVRSGGEVEVVAVFEEFQGFGSGGTRSRPDQNGMNFDLAGKSGVCC